MKRYKYQARVTLLPPGDGAGQAALPGPTCRAVIRAYHHETHRGRLFSALVSSDEGEPGGNSSRTVTMVLLGDGVGDYLAPGERFVLCRGGDVGYGLVTRRIFV